jgi:hypothetical protein
LVEREIGINRSGSVDERERGMGGHTWGNRAEREVRNGKGKREGENRGSAGDGGGMDGLGEEEWG